MLEHGAYNLIMDAYYDRERAPTKAEALRVARAKSPEEVAAVEAVLAEFFHESEGVYLQKRIEEELAEFHQRQATNREIGARGGLAKAKRFASDSLDERLAKSKPSHKPLATSQEEAEKERPAKRRPPPKTTIPDDFAVSPAVTAWASAKGWNASDYLEGFVSRAKAKAYRYADWDAAFRNCITDDWPSVRARAGPPARRTAMDDVAMLEEMKRGLATGRTADGISEAASLALGERPDG